MGPVLFCSLVSVVVCNAAGGPAAGDVGGRAAGTARQYGNVPLWPHLVSNRNRVARRILKVAHQGAGHGQRTFPSDYYTICKADDQKATAITQSGVTTLSCSKISTMSTWWNTGLMQRTRIHPPTVIYLKCASR